MNATVHLDANGAVAHGDDLSVVVHAYNAPQRMPGDALIAVSIRESQKVMVDLTPPVLGQVYDLTPCTDVNCQLGSGSIDFVGPTAQIAARWDGFLDAESGVTHYDYCVGSGTSKCDLVAMTRVPGVIVNGTLPTQVQANLPSDLVHGALYCVSVQAMNGVGLVSVSVSSSCVRVDATPPVMLHVRIGLDPNIHMDEQSSGAVIFGAAAAQDDLSIIDAAEWCVATSTPSPLVSIGGSSTVADNFTDWAYAACDVVKPKTAPIEDGAKAAGTTKMIMGAEAGVVSGTTIYIGVRTRNLLGLFSTWVWSNSTKVGATSATVDPKESKSNVALSVEIPGYDAQGESDDTKLAPTAKMAMLGVSNKTTGLKYDESGGRRRRLMEAASPEREGVWEEMMNAPLSFGPMHESVRRRLGSSTIHLSTLAFSLDLNAATNEVFVYSLKYNTSDLLVTAVDETVLARLVPTLWGYIEATAIWVRAKTTCDPEVVYALQVGLYAVSVCANAGAKQFKLTFQASPSASMRWAGPSCNGTNTSSPAWLSTHMAYSGIDVLDFLSPTVLTRYQPALSAGEASTSLVLDGTFSSDIDGGSVVKQEWSLGWRTQGAAAAQTISLAPAGGGRRSLRTEYGRGLAQTVTGATSVVVLTSATELGLHQINLQVRTGWMLSTR